MPAGLVYGLLRHDRAVVAAGLAAVVAIAWLYLLLGAGLDMDAMGPGGGGMMAMAPAWTPGYATLIFLMWAIMMAAMMLPSAAPTILLAAALAGKTAATGRGASRAAAFGLGYLLVWVGFSLAATLLQWGLSRLGMLSPAMASRSTVVAGLILVAAGLYQWTPLKQACLVHCRSPLELLVRYGRMGFRQMVGGGIRHGAFCLGCCWMLMALLFVGGLMNLLWIAGLALLVLIEKTLPWGLWASRLTGVALAIWGMAMLASAIYP